MASRRGARKLALDLLYEHELTHKPIDELLARAASNPALEHAERLVRGVHENREAIDALIAQHAEGWELSRMPVVDLCLMRMGAFEITRVDDIPDAVAINEAVELAKIYSTEDSGRFINGVLDTIASGAKH